MKDAVSPLSDVTNAAIHGAKAVRLAKLIAAGAPAPRGFAFAEHVTPDELGPAIASLAERSGGVFGDADAPMLLSLRSSPEVSGAPSCPAILNLGLTKAVMDGVAKRIGALAAADLRRRLIQNFAVNVMGADPEAFEAALFDRMKTAGAADEEALDLAALTALEEDFLALTEDETGDEFPEVAEDQLALAIAAMRRSWNSPTAKILRQAKGIDPASTQGLIAQAMVLGVGSGFSGSGVASSRSEEDGEPVFSGRFLLQSQGEDALMGLRTPRMLTAAAREAEKQPALSLEEESPEITEKLRRLCALSEQIIGDACRLEFTLEGGEVYILDAEPLRPSARAAVRISVDLAEAGVISRNQALLRIDPSALTSYLHPTVSPGVQRDVIGKGLAASPGAASGSLVFSPEAAESYAAREKPAIWCGWRPARKIFAACTPPPGC